MAGNRTILVTGGAGFIGAACRALLARGDGVRVLDSLIQQVRAGRGGPAEQRADVEPMHGDVRDREMVGTEIRGVDSIVRLAAGVGVGTTMHAGEPPSPDRGRGASSYDRDDRERVDERHPDFAIVDVDIDGAPTMATASTAFDATYTLALSASSTADQCDPKHTMMTDVPGTRQPLPLAERTGACFLLTPILSKARPSPIFTVAEKPRCPT